eukprot:gene1880-2560_t
MATSTASAFSGNLSTDPANIFTAFGDTYAPDVGYTCGSCPEGFVGDGINCEVDQCSSADFGGCDPLVNCTSAPGGGVVCGSCPQGYDGDGTSCEERDECAINNGDCDYRTNCTNTVRDGTLLPSTLTDAILQIFLQGDADGRSHTFKLTASKGDRSSSLYTTVTVGKGAPPVPAIMPIPGKVNTGAALTMQASVAVGNSSGASSLWWSAYQQTEGAEGDIVDLLADAGVLASESRSGSTLVLHPNALAENTTYVFELEAVSQEDGSVGRSSAKVVTNTPPSGGQLLVTPTTGTVLQTEYTVNTSGWEDTDLPLFSSFSYRVIGDDTRAGVILSAVGPQQVLTLKMPESGLEEFGSVVEVAAHVEDRYGCKANPVLFNITVMAVEFTSDSEMHDFVDSTVSESETLLSNGQAADALNSITGSISILAGACWLYLNHRWCVPLAL